MQLYESLKLSENMSDDDSPLGEDEEETLVYVEFESLSGPNTFCNENLQLDMIGLDTEHPLMQVNGKYYEGIYEDAVGTYMFFENDDNPKVDDPIFDRIPTLKYFNKTNKILKMKRVFVKPKLDVLGDSDQPNCIPNLETLKEAGVPLNYQEDALKLWEKMRKDRLKALNEYLEKHRQRKEKRQQGIEPDSESDDDNPFAMYKSDAKTLDPTTQSEQDQENSASSNNNNFYEQLTVIDPGPSTSKDSVPWTSPTRDPLQENESDESNQPKIKIRNQGYIEVLQRKKPKKVIKKQRRSKKSNKVVSKVEETETIEKAQEQSIATNCEAMDVVESNSESIKTVLESESISDKNNEENQLESLVSSSSKHQTDEDQVCQRVEEMEISTEIQPTESQEEIVEDNNLKDKKLEKQRKRDAKMQEISERLKKPAEVVKSGVH